MKSPKYFGQPKRPRILIRRIVGESMQPTLKPGQIVIATGRFKRLKLRDLVIIQHQGRQKIKRIAQVDPLKGVFVLGDNPDKSTDSRTFGWLLPDEVIAVVLWPRSR